MKSNRILTIGRHEFLLPESMNDSQALGLALQLCGLREVDSRYLPTADSEYGPRVWVAEEKFEQVGVMVTPSHVMSAKEYEVRRAAGMEAYRAAHPNVAA